MTTEYERGRIAGIETAAKVFDAEAEAAHKNGMDTAAMIFERHAELVRQILPPASPASGGEPCPDCTALVGEVTPCIVPYDAPTPTAPSCPAAGAGVVEAERALIDAVEAWGDARDPNRAYSAHQKNVMSALNRLLDARALASSAQRGEPNG